MVNTLRVSWPADKLCHSGFYTAMRARETATYTENRIDPDRVSVVK